MSFTDSGSMLSVLKQNGQTSTKLYSGLSQQEKRYLTYVQDQEKAARQLVESWLLYSQYYNEAISKINVDSADSFEEYRQKILEEAKRDDVILDLLVDEILSVDTLEIAVNSFMSTASQFSDWYDQWKHDINGESVYTELISFNIADYKENGVSQKMGW